MRELFLPISDVKLLPEAQPVQVKLFFASLWQIPTPLLSNMGGKLAPVFGNDCRRHRRPIVKFPPTAAPW